MKDLTAGLVHRNERCICQRENDQKLPRDVRDSMDRQDEDGQRRLSRITVAHSCGSSLSCRMNAEVVHPRSQTGFVRFFDVRMKVENREKDRREKKRVDDPEYHQDRVRRLQARRQHGDDTAPDADHPS